MEKSGLVRIAVEDHTIRIPHKVAIVILQQVIDVVFVVCVTPELRRER